MTPGGVNGNLCRHLAHQTAGETIEMSFLQLVLSLDKTKEEIILLWRICQFDRYRNSCVSNSPG